MQIYLVGGAVRDRLLGLPARERDWVVVGAVAEDLEREGYRPVGKSFPVYLHPDTGEEYALARREIKTGPGYHGFEFDTRPDVSLEEDLSRRDLTINAMAEDEQGELIDPWGGRDDLEQKRLRHISTAFTEDPVRILRVARFATRFQPLGFSVAQETLELMQKMVQSGEADALTPERVWQETLKALGEMRPWVFFEVLRQCGALERVFPEISRLFGVPQPERWHPEIDTGVHTLMTLRQAAKLSGRPDVRFAALVHDLGKADTPKEEWPSHRGHEERGARRIVDMCRRLAIPNNFRQLGVAAARCHTLVHRAEQLRPKTLLKLLETAGAFRDPSALENMLTVCTADARGRTGRERDPYRQADLVRAVFQAATNVDTKRLAERGLEGAMGEAVKKARLEAIQKARRDFPI